MIRIESYYLEDGMLAKQTVDIKNLLLQAQGQQYDAPDEAIALYQQVLLQAEADQLFSEMAEAYLGISYAARNKTDTKVMLENGLMAFDVYEGLKDNYGQAKSLNMVGIAYFYNSMYEQAVKYLLEAVKICKSIDDGKLMAAIYNNLAEVYREAEKFDTAIDYYEKALESIQQLDIALTRGIIYSNMGEVFLSQNNYDQAKSFLFRAIDLFEDMSADVVHAEAETRLGKLYYRMGNIETSKVFYEKALRRFEKTNNRFYIVDALIHSAELHALEDINRAYFLLEKALRYAEESSARKKMSLVCKMFAELYESEGDYRMAYDYFRRYHYLEQEVKATLLGDTLEILKIELFRLELTSNEKNIIDMRKHFENEIQNQKSELMKIQSLNKQLEEKVYVDALTGIANRSCLDTCLSDLMTRVLGQDRAILLFMIDIDEFKSYNDFWGHLKGDICLTKVAEVMESIRLQRDDILGRYGGEEFIYCSLDHDKASALELGNKLRKAVENLKIKYDFDKNAKDLTITLGGVLINGQEEFSLDQLINAADKALYQGKRSGRNRVIISDTLGD
jgi:diguanylate cyclase (GGDEF)-like protein